MYNTQPTHEDYSARARYLGICYWISSYISHNIIRCNYLSMPEIPASGGKSIIYALAQVYSKLCRLDTTDLDTTDLVRLCSTLPIGNVIN